MGGGGGLRKAQESYAALVTPAHSDGRGAGRLIETPSEPPAPGPPRPSGMIESEEFIHTIKPQRT